MNKVLFLDMDGVILAGRHWKETPHREDIPSDTIALLNEICERSGAVVVVSSTWRSDVNLRRRLHRAGFTGRFHRDWRTPRNDHQPWGIGGTIRNLDELDPPRLEPYQYPCRGDEIADWLRRNSPDRFCIIDDDSDMLARQKPFFIKTQFEVGLTRDHVEMAIAILG